MAAESKLSTGTQNSAVRSLKEWRRKGVARASAAIRAGATIPEDMTRVLNVRTVPAMIQQAQRLLGLLGEHAPAMDKVGAPTQPLIDEGRKLCEALIAADSNQELTRGSTLPVVVSNFYARKAELYTGLKMINDAGHELYAHDPPSSSRFNLSLLHRRHVAGTAEGPAHAAFAGAAGCDFVAAQPACGCPVTNRTGLLPSIKVFAGAKIRASPRRRGEADDVRVGG